MLSFLKRKKSLNRKLKTRPKLYRLEQGVLDWGKKIGIALVVAALFVGAYKFFMASHIFELKSVAVAGVHPHLTDEDIVTLAAAPLGRNLFLVRLRELEANLKRFSWIKEVSVRRSLPGTILLEVKEHQPYAILEVGPADNLEFYYVSGEGVIFRRIGEQDGRDFPVISGFLREELEDHPNYVRERINVGFEFLKNYADAAKDTGTAVMRVNLSRADGLSALLVSSSDGLKTEVYFGTGAINEKISRWIGFYKVMRDRQEHYVKVDLHVPEKIFARGTGAQPSS